ncbi:ferredoxin reductase [Streptococcus pantholopis]|uniref:Ferredoxin reductase n=1 Tax=Streptococcus pantholopis TaxID=1811193 RepID=A0A172QAG6_9STRE|nr:ferredoxin reductase [Streptococcus pantholopis]AND80493.1 ferredoxin reductase [Streptococcus pantholopis]
MKGRSKMITIVVSILSVGFVGCLITWGVMAFLGRSQSLSVKSIENPSGDIYLIHLTKPKDMAWEAGSFAKFALPEVKESGQASRWLTIASNSDESEILILTHNSGSLYKETLTNLPAGTKVEMSWMDSHLPISDGGEPLVCFASDVGIAAMRPIVKDWISKRSIVLNHLDKGVTVFDKELSKMANHEESFSYETSTTISQSQNKPTEAVKQYGNKAIYLLSGQPDDLETMKGFLEDKGIDTKQVKTDSFTGLK